MCKARLLAAITTGMLLLGVPAADAATQSITTVAGTTAGFSGDSGPATAAQLNTPDAVVPTSDGGYLIADQQNARIRKVAADGTITTVAGNGTSGFSGDGGPATAAELNTPDGVAPLPGGGFLIADAGNNRIRRVDANGTITTVAGTGAGGYNGDNIAATTATLAFPSDVAVTSDGSYLISDNDNNRIRKVDAMSGMITTVAGTGTAGYNGDGAVATTQINDPLSVALTSDGGFLVADTNNRRIRKVLDGQVTTVVGDGTSGDGGDGGAATSAQLTYPARVATVPDGGYLIADSHDDRVRRVSSSGTISTVAGDGTAGSTGDGGPAASAQLNLPLGVAVTADNDFLIADGENHRIRRVDAGDAGTVTPPPDNTPPPTNTNPPPPPAPVTPHNVTPPRVVGTKQNTGFNYSCDDGTWAGLANDPQFSYAIWEKSTSTGILRAPDRVISRNQPVFVAISSAPRLFYCSVTAKTDTGGTIEAQGSAVQVPGVLIGPGNANDPVVPQRTGDFRIRGIDVFQITQPNSNAQTYAFDGFPQAGDAFANICGGGTPTGLTLGSGCTASGAASQTATYDGVTIDPGKKLTAVVYLDRKPGDSVQLPNQKVDVTLRMTAPGRVNKTLTESVTAGSLPSSPSDAVTSDERGNPRYGLTFDIPQQWVVAAASPSQGKFDLEAKASIGAGAFNVVECGSSLVLVDVATTPCTDNDDFKLTGVSARTLTFSPILRVITLLKPKQDPSKWKTPQEILKDAREVLPGGENFQVGDYQGTQTINTDSAITSCAGGTPTETPTDKANRDRKCASNEVEAEMKTWAALPGNGTGYHMLVGIHDYSYDPGYSNEPGAQFGNKGIENFGRGVDGPMIQINNLSDSRPLTSASHEVTHTFGVPHAGANLPTGDLSCGGDVGDQHGELWPPDNSGRLQGVKFDPETDTRTVDSASGATGTQELYDLMSYCTQGNEDVAWLSPRNWNRVFSAMIDGETKAVQSPKVTAADTSSGSGFVVGTYDYGYGVARITHTQPAAPGNTVPAPDPTSPLHVRAYDASGKLLADNGAQITIDQSTGGATFMAPIPAGTRRVELVNGGAVVDTRAASHPPTLKLLAPGKGVHAKKNLVVRWSASDPDHDALTAAVEYSADGKHNWHTVFSGSSTGSATLGAGMLAGGTRARVRVQVTDGFNDVTALSPPIVVDGTPPLAEIDRPLATEKLTAAAPVVLQGQAHDDAQRRLRGRSITWYAGSKKVGTGEMVSAKLAAGSYVIKLVARDSRGRTTTVTRKVRVAAVPLQIETLSAAGVKHGAKSATVTVATNVNGTMTIRGHRYATTTRSKHYKIALPKSPTAGQVKLPVKVTPNGGGKAITATLVVLRG